MEGENREKFNRKNFGIGNGDKEDSQKMKLKDLGCKKLIKMSQKIEKQCKN